MTVSFFIPKKINVGYQERQGTYTGKLAYVTYFDEKGKLRKETSWNGWRKKELGNDIIENEPTSGFVLNKKAGGYSSGWNHRQTYVRVYDPRGFEFEITVPNLLYILENATSTKGKGLEGEFVYGWDGKDLVLIPTDAPDYKELVRLNELRHSEKKIGARDLKVGATYLTRDNKEWIYMGKFDEYDTWRGEKKKTKSFFFFVRDKYSYGEEQGGFETIKSPTQKLVDVISEEPVDDFANIFDRLERNKMYSPIDESRDEYVPYTFNDFTKKIDGRSNWWTTFFFSDFDREKGDMIEQKIRYDNDGKYAYYREKEVERTYGYHWNQRTELVKAYVTEYADTLEEAFNILKPHKKLQYLENGKFYGEVN